MERCRRGKQHAARRGSVNVLSGAPYGYRYIGKHEADGEARYQVLAEEARIVRKIFEWVGHERCSIGEVCRRLQRDGIPTRTGKPAWDRATVWLILKNPACKGTAAFGKTRSGEFKPQRLRPQRGRPERPRRPISRADTSSEDQVLIEVPGLVSEDLFGAVRAQLEENRQRRRDRPGRGNYLLQGLVVCKRCGYGCYSAFCNQLRTYDVTAVVSEELALFRPEIDMPNPELANVVEAVIMLRYVELRSQLYRLISIMKMRESRYDTPIREFRITDRGLDVAATFESAEAILTGHGRAIPPGPGGSGGSGAGRGEGS